MLYKKIKKRIRKEAKRETDKQKVRHQIPYRRRALPKVGLIIGFMAVFLSVTVAYRAPATAYEVSIYGHTPIIFWFSISVALFVSIVISMNSNHDRWYKLSSCLGVLSVETIILLPIIRNYFYIGGAGDNLTHIGRAKFIREGLIPMLDFKYPAFHTITIYTESLTGVRIHRTMALISLLFPLVFFAFVPLVVREFKDQRLFVVTGLFSALMLLPISWVAVHLEPFPTAQAIMVFPMMLFLILRARLENVRYIIVFALASVTFVLIHPQQASNLLIFLLAIVTYNILGNSNHIRDSQFYIEEATLRTRNILILTAILGIVFWIFVQGIARFEVAIQLLASRIFDPQVAEEAASKTGGLSEIGVSAVEMFAKIFLISFIYCIFYAIVGTQTVLQYFINSQKPQKYQYMIILSLIGFIPILIIFVTYVVAGISLQYFRHLGFIMALVTITGSVGLVHIVKRVPALSFSGSRRLVTIVLIIFMMVSVLTIHPSPYIYTHSKHIPETQIAGYETTFEYWNEEPNFVYIRAKTWRYGDAIQGPTERTEPGKKMKYHGQRYGSHDVPDHFSRNGLNSQYNETKLMPVTTEDRMRFTEVVPGYRYSSSDFEYVKQTPGIDKVLTNGGFDLNVIHPTSE